MSRISFSEDSYSKQQSRLARYQAAFFIAMGLNIAAMGAVALLAKTQKLIPLLVHHYDNGVTTIEPMQQTKAPPNRAQVESDIVRYVVHRESYDLHSFRGQYDLVQLLSHSSVAREYAASQSIKNKNAPLVQLADVYTRNVHIYSIHFLDTQDDNQRDIRKNHDNLAEVVFRVTDTHKATGKQASTSYNALMAWRYLQPSNSPEIRWQNFDGFQVMRYQRQVRNETPHEK